MSSGAKLAALVERHGSISANDRGRRALQFGVRQEAFCNAIDRTHQFRFGERPAIASRTVWIDLGDERNALAMVLHAQLRQPIPQFPYRQLSPDSKLARALGKERGKLRADRGHGSVQAFLLVLLLVVLGFLLVVIVVVLGPRRGVVVVVFTRLAVGAVVLVVTVLR